MMIVPQLKRDWPHVQQRCPMPAALPDGSPWPKISIVTPTFNQGKYIEETILSVLHQDYPNVEHLILDGASTDQTAEVVGKYRDRIHTFISEKDKGQSDAINKGMRLATGDILTWLNSDDMLAPGALYAMALAFYYSRADIISGVVVLRSDNQTVARHITGCCDGSLALRDLLDLENCWQRGQFWYQPETFFSRSIWEKAGSYVREDLFWSMDYDLWLRFAEQGANLHAIGRDVAWFRLHDEQKTHGQTVFLPELQKVRDDFVARAGSPGARPATDPPPVARAARSLRFVFFNDMGPAAGAGIGHTRIATALATAGHEVRQLALAPTVISTRKSAAELVELVEQEFPDVVVVGNLHGANIDPALPGLLAKKFPTVQILHDFWSITGRCAYPGDCTQYHTGCDEKCPTQQEYPIIPADQIKPAWEKKIASHKSESAPILAGVSRYVEEVLKTRFLSEPAKPQVTRVKCPLDLGIFKPRDKATCRDLLGLPQDKFIILFSANNTSDKRKGFDHLLQALDLLALPDALGVCIGHFDQSQIASRNPKIPLRSMGYLTDLKTVASLYSASDLFIAPSLIETFGQVFIEAAACGTPSVGYPTGGVKESIADGISGKLAESINPAHLAEAIAHLYNNPDLRERLSAFGRLWVENEFSFASSAQLFWSNLRALGLLEKLGAAPGISLNYSAFPRPVDYLEPAIDIVNGSANGHSTLELQLVKTRQQLAEAEQRAGLTKSEINRLRHAAQQSVRLRQEIDAMKATRTWRTVQSIYPLYQRLISPSKWFGK
jgi:glycosyltransferase involved in cell wall biosynthesis